MLLWSSAVDDPQDDAVFGAGVSWVRTVFAEDGTLISSEVLLHPTDDDGVGFLATDLAP
ncbi:MAG: hypothetical protein ACFCGT_03555 [Sandaracinaceae bacterium]